MAIKIEVGPEVAKDEYPWIGISTDSGVVVMFTSRENGFVLRGDNIHRIGARSTSWNMCHFKRYDGKITLQND